MTEKERNKRIKDLLYLHKCIETVIFNEIEECIMLDRPSTYEEIKEHIIYQVDERFRM